MNIRDKDYQEVIAVPIKDNCTEWSDDQPVFHLDVNTVMTHQEDEEDGICFAKAELLAHLKISGPLRVLVTDLTAKRLGGGDPFDLSTEVSTAFPLHMITTTSRTILTTSSSLLSERNERCPHDHHDDDAVTHDSTHMDPSSSSFDDEDPSQKQKRKRRRRRRRRRMVAAAVSCGVVGGVFLGPVGLAAGAASGAFVIRTASKIGERRKDARTARITPRRWYQNPAFVAQR